jgi:hypothetical protein
MAELVLLNNVPLLTIVFPNPIILIASDSGFPLLLPATALILEFGKIVILLLAPASKVLGPVPEYLLPPVLLPSFVVVVRVAPPVLSPILIAVPFPALSDVTLVPWRIAPCSTLIVVTELVH